MKQVLTTPCKECPFLESMRHGLTLKRLTQLALQDMPCHKTCEVDEGGEDATGDYVPSDKSVYCAGAMIFLAKRKDKFVYGFDDSKLNMDAPVR